MIVTVEAGLGKSTDMAYLAYKLCIKEDKGLYPILVPLRDFLDSIKINEYIPERYKNRLKIFLFCVLIDYLV